VLGSVQFVDDQAGTTSQPFAQPYGLRDLRAVIREGKLPQKGLASWEQGAWTLTPQPFGYVSEWRARSGVPFDLGASDKLALNRSGAWLYSRM